MRTGPSCLLPLHPSLAQCQGPLHQESLREVDSALYLVSSSCVASNRGQVARPYSQISIQLPAQESEMRLETRICGPEGVQSLRPYFPLATMPPQLDAPPPEADL